MTIAILNVSDRGGGRFETTTGLVELPAEANDLNDIPTHPQIAGDGVPQEVQEQIEALLPLGRGLTNYPVGFNIVMNFRQTKGKAD